MGISSASSSFTNKEGAKKILRMESFVPATCLVVAVDSLTRGACFAWEIETIFEYLEEHNCLPNESARDRLLAGMAILSNPSFLWDATVFKSVAQTINGKVALPDHWEPLSAGEVCYAVKEINSLYSIYESAKDLSPLYAEEPKIYIAGCCAYSGFGKLPDALTFCEPQLERFFSNPEDPVELSSNEVSARKHEEVQLYSSVMGKIREDLLEQIK